MNVANNWWVRGAAAVVVIGLVAVASWWFFIRSNAELATAPIEFRDVTPTVVAGDAATPTVSAATGSPTGVVVTAPEGVETYVILPEHPSVDGATEAAYFADEQFAGVSIPSTAKGVSYDVSGQIHLDGEGIAADVESVITVGLTTLRSDESRRDNRVNQALQVTTFPQATFVARELSGYPGDIPEGQDLEMTLTGPLTLKGVEREVTWDVIARRNGDVLTALAEVNFLYADFDIPILNVAGFVSVDDDVTLQVQLIAERQ